MNKNYSYNYKSLPKGCKYCIKGEKLVLFITGFCPRKCSYCPLSEKKKDKDVIYANELKINENDFDKLVKEAKSHKAKGAGITGGDPLAKIDRTCDYIARLKTEFGPKFHIHLYTSFNLVNKKKLQQLYESGLDEIRFHPNIENNKIWERIKIARDFDWDVGVEIPILPDKLEETKNLIEFARPYLDFINLNELEYSDNKSYNTKYKTKNEETYAIESSLEQGLKIMKYCKKLRLKCHLCTAKLKDKVQLKNRMIKKAKNVKLNFENQRDGLIIRSCIYLKNNSPRNKPLSKIKNVDLNIYVNELGLKKYKLESSRIITSKKELKKLKKHSKLDYCIIEEYPTADHFIVSAEFLD